MANDLIEMPNGDAGAAGRRTRAAYPTGVPR
jgi:hypothetical protein